MISVLLVIIFHYFSLFIVLLQIVALREQNAHIQRKVASGEGAEDLLEGTDAQKVHGKVGTYSCQALNCLRVVHVFSTVRFCSTNAVQ